MGTCARYSLHGSICHAVQYFCSIAVLRHICLVFQRLQRLAFFWPCSCCGTEQVPLVSCSELTLEICKGQSARKQALSLTLSGRWQLTGLDAVMAGGC